MKNINDFNEETQLIIKQFIENLFVVLPNLTNITSEGKIQEIVLKNINHNIEFNAVLPKRITGQYNSKEKKVYISNTISKDEQKIKLTVFHEMIHAVTADIYTDELIKDNPYITEVLTTLLEEKYNEMIVKRKTFRNRVNGYIPDFGRQLQLIYGDELLEQFIVAPLKLYSIFNGFNEDIKKFLYKKTVKELELLNYSIKNMADDSKIKTITYQIEKNIVDQLYFAGFSNKSRSDVTLIENLFCLQHYPDVLTYSNMLLNISNCIELEECQVLKFLKFADKNTEKEKLIDELKKIHDKDLLNQSNKKIRDIVMQKVFGYASEDFNGVQPNIFDFLENEDMYSAVFDLIIAGDISVSEIDNFKFRRCSSSSSKFSTKLTFDIMAELFGHTSLPTFVLCDSKDSIISIFNEYEMEYKKHQIKDIEEGFSYSMVASQITSYLKCIAEQNSISDFYWDALIPHADNGWEDYSFEIYYRKSESELVEVNFSFDEMQKLKIKNKTIPMAEAKSLIVRTGDVNLGTNTKY